MTQGWSADEADCFFSNFVKPELDLMKERLRAEDTKMSQYHELDSLRDTDLYLDTPLSLIVTGGEGNWVAFWEETQTMDEKVEGEGETVEAALDDCRVCLLGHYRKLEKDLRAGHMLSADDDRTWTALCHYIGSRKSGKTRPGEEYNIADKGPVFG